ncbi:MAG TPA: DPP IV N-terminal domain-containing protein [Thermoanaerobaculia bacterium]|nr:DPP IV N-terminal domain-containing protein [Thermoanaerobaculia bacterium]
MRTFLLSFVVLTALTSATAATQQKQPEVLGYDAMFAEDSSGKGAENPLWSSDGRRLLYVLDDDLWMLDVTQGTAAEPLFRRADLRKAAGKDAGFDRIVWSPRGDSLVLVAGGDLWLLPLGKGELRRLTSTSEEESDPKPSPDGSRVAFVRDFDLWLLDLATGSEQALTTDGQENTLLNGVTDWLYWEEIWDREATGYWWSPDGTRIAYYRFDERQVPLHPLVDQSPVHPQPKPQRYPLPGDPNPLVRVGVLDLAGGKTTWLETGAPDRYLARVAWTPAGDAVAIQALARSQARLDLLRCGAADGRCSTLLTDQWPTWVNLGKDFAFLPDGRFLWGSERDGWRRLYLAGADGKIVRPVSPEGWAVTSLDGVADDGSWAIFTAYRAQGLGPAERHVLRARLDQRLYQEAKWENLTVAAAENAAEVDPHTGAWVHSWSTADLPPRSEVRRADGSIVPLPWIPPSTFDPAALPPYTYFTIPGPDGSRLPARMIQPPGFDPARRYPVIVYQYGGPASQVVFRHWDARRRDLWHKRMAQRGYVIFSVDNQVSLFFGKAGEDRDHRRMGEANLAGQLAGIDWLKAQTWVDPSRIGLWGWSGGGYNTLYCLLNRPGVWKAGVAGAPVTDWRLYDAQWTERYLGTPQENESGYRESSPLTYAARLADRLLIVHGLADDNVHPLNSVVMSDALIKAGLPFEQAFYPGQKHGFEPTSMRHFFARMEEFFDRTLTPEGRTAS